MSRSPTADSRTETAAGPSRAPDGYACPSCGAARPAPFYELDAVPAQSSVLLSSERRARSLPTARIELASCLDCGFATNIRFDSTLLDRTLEREDSQACSGTFGAFAESLVSGLIDRFDLRGKRVTEIGCGKGDFLALLCKRGDNWGIGIDPAGDPGRLPAEVADRVRVQMEPFGRHHADLIGDIVCCRHTLEHIPEVGDFLGNLRAAIGDRSEVVVFFEVPDATRIFREGAFWDVYHEHCSYFTAGSLARSFRRAGFEILDLRRTYGGQYLHIEARTADRSSGAQPDVGPLNGMAEIEERTMVAGWAETFGSRVGRKVERWRARVRALAAEGKGVALWGSGSKAVGFLTALGLVHEVACIVDINPHRQGRYSPGTGHRIVGPEELLEVAPGAVVVMNPLYRDEIRAELQALELDPRLLTLGN